MTKVVAKALIKNKFDQVLVLVRGLSHPNFPSHFDLPGGELDLSEDGEQAVAREIKEETGIAADASDLNLLFKKHHKGVVHLLYGFRLKSGDNKITLSWEHSGFSWLSADDVLDYDYSAYSEKIDPYYQDVLDYLSYLPTTR